METIQTIEPRFTLRFATPDDAAQIVSFMKKLGAYQHMLEKTIVTEEAMRQLLSEKKGEALMGDYDGTPGAFIYFYPNSAAFTGRTGIYIDAFWVDDGLRGKGLGSIMMAFMSNLVIDREAAVWNGSVWTGTPPPPGFTKTWGLMPVIL